MDIHREWNVDADHWCIFKRKISRVHVSNMEQKTYTEDEVKRISDVAAMGIDISYIKKILDEISSRIDTFAIKADLYQLRNDTSIATQGFENRLRTVEAQNNAWLGRQQIIAGAIGIAAGLLGSLIQVGKL